MTIEFLQIREPYGWCSNFHPTEVFWQDYTWPTSEHAYQAAKFLETDPDWADEIREADSPWIAKRMGNSREHPIPEDWDEQRVEVMHEIVYAKFDQNFDLAKKLIATGDVRIEEALDRDDFWANGGDGSGQNKLGEILMQVRSEMRERLPKAANDMIIRCDAIEDPIFVHASKLTDEDLDEFLTQAASIVDLDDLPPAASERVGRMGEMVDELSKIQRDESTEAAKAWLSEHKEEFESLQTEVDEQIMEFVLEDHADYLREKMHSGDLSIPSGSYLLLKDDGNGGVEVEFFCEAHGEDWPNFDVAIKGEL